MSAPLVAPSCAACGHVVWPPRSLCPECGSGRWTARPADEGVVEERTVVTSPAGASVAIASVRLAAGPVVLAAAAAVEPGDAVRLTYADGVLLATVRAAAP